MRLFLTFCLLSAAFLFVACDDGSKSDTDTDTVPTDDGSTTDTDTTGNDTILSDEDETAGDEDTTPTDEVKPDDDTYVIGDCTPITITNVVLISGSNRYEGGFSEPLGDETLADIFSLQFYIDETTVQTELAVGTYDLGAGKNKNFATCTECALIFEDYNPDEGTIAKRYFQYDGSIEISEVKPGTLESKGTIDARLVEVTIESGTYISTPIAGGTCYKVTGSWDTICVPDCTDKACGPDGCGGVCGEECEAGFQCNAEQTDCVPCTVVHISDIAPNASYPNVYEGVIAEKLGDETFDDLFWIEFYGTQAVGTHDLASTNYFDCPWCIMIAQDSSEDPAAKPKNFFQDSGSLIIEAINPVEGEMGAESKGRLEGVRLVEVTVASDYTSTPVPGGACITIADTAWDTMPAETDEDSLTPDN